MPQTSTVPDRHLARRIPQQRPDTPAVTGAAAPAVVHDVALVGLGYVGLPTALTFHAGGASVLGLDVSESRLADVRSGAVDVLASDRRRLVEALGDPERFELTADPTMLRQARAVIVAVPTPVDEHLTPDLVALRGACRTVVDQAVPGQTLILTSTTYVGSTHDLLVRPLAERGLMVGRDVFVAFSPERIDPGNDRHAHEDVPRVVGGVTEECTQAALEVLSGSTAKLHPVSSAGAAEMTKLLENTFRAVNIAFANEMADICSELDLNVVEIVDAAATKPYGFMPFYPGPGVGGHCIPCDPHYLLWQMRARRHTPAVIGRAMDAIASRPAQVVDRAQQVLSVNGHGIVGARVLVLGVSYKPDVEDVRESPALEIIEGLRRAGAEVTFHDPHVSSLRMPDGSLLDSSPVELVSDSDLVLLHTAHAALDPTWTSHAQVVLDTTFRLPAGPGRWTL